MVDIWHQTCNLHLIFVHFIDMQIARSTMIANRKKNPCHLVCLHMGELHVYMHNYLGVNVNKFKEVAL